MHWYFYTFNVLTHEKGFARRALGGCAPEVKYGFDVGCWVGEKFHAVLRTTRAATLSTRCASVQVMDGNG